MGAIIQLRKVFLNLLPALEMLRYDGVIRIGW